MGRDLQYPKISEEEKYCPSHSGIKYIDYAGRCPLCVHDYVFMVNEEMFFPIPEQVSYVGLFYENLRYFTAFMIAVLFSRPALLIFLVPYLLLFSFLYFVFKNLARGIFTLSSFAYSVTGYLAIIMGTVFMFSAMAMFKLNPVMLIVFLAFLIPSILLYGSERVRKLFNMSDKMKEKLNTQRDLLPEPTEGRDNLIYYIRRMFLAVLIIIPIVLSNMITYLANF